MKFQDPLLGDRCERGFTLAELAVVLFIVALLAGVMVVPLAAQVERQNLRSAISAQEELKQALLGFAASNGYLPCPAKSASDGAENRKSDGTCQSGYSGILPWATLGVQRSDPWQRLWGYVVTPAFANALGFQLTSSGTIAVRTRDSSGALISLASTSSVAAAIVSYGKNGYGATSESGTIIPNSSTGTKNNDEKTNMALGSALVAREQSENVNASGGEFDDLVTWLPSTILFNRMIAAGRLP